MRSGKAENSFGEPAEEPAESEKLPYAVSTGEIAAVFAEEPADLSVPESEPAETAIEAMEEEAPPRSVPKKPAKKAPASEGSEQP